MDKSMFINLTPHPVNLMLENGSVIEVPPSGASARIQMQKTEVGKLEDVLPIIHERPKQIWGLDLNPGQAEFLRKQGKRFIIVSRMVAEAARDTGMDKVIKADHGLTLVYPTEFVRDSEGRVIGCKALGKA